MPLRRSLVPEVPARWVVGAAGVGCLVGIMAVYRLELAVILVVIASCIIGALLVRIPSAILHMLVVVLFAESLSVGPLSVGRLLAIGAVLALAVRLVMTSWRPGALPTWSWVPVVLFVIWAWASGLWASVPSAWGFAMGQLALAVCFYTAFALLLSSAAQLRPLLVTYAAGATAAAIVGCVQFALGARATGLQGDPNLYAIYQVAALPAIVVLSRTTRRHRTMWRLALVATAASIVASGSRGGLLATLVTGLVMVVGRARRGPEMNRRSVGALAIAGIALLGVLVVASITVNHRLNPGTVAKDRASGRVDIWYVAATSVERHPLLGIGGGNFKPQSVSLLQTTPGVGLTKSHLLESGGIEVHNVYLETVTEYGVVGGALWLLLLGSAFAGLLAAERRLGSTGPVTALVPMLIAFMTAAIFVSVVNSKLLWMLVGLAAALQTAPLRSPSLSADPSPR